MWEADGGRLLGVLHPTPGGRYTVEMSWDEGLLLVANYDGNAVEV